MKERGILFSAPMVRKLLSGEKTQTRRIRKLGVRNENDPSPSCPYGSVGDRLWARETWRPVMESWRSFVEYAAGGPDMAIADRRALEGLSRVALRFPGARADVHSESWHPSIHMPRWASRITLEITGVTLERVQSISEEDARAEGVEIDNPDNPRTERDESICRECGGTGLRMGLGQSLGVIFDVDCTDCDTLRKRFRNLWHHINGRESWERNPFVWAISFKPVEVRR